MSGIADSGAASLSPGTLLARHSVRPGFQRYLREMLATRSRKQAVGDPGCPVFDLGPVAKIALLGADG